MISLLVSSQNLRMVKGCMNVGYIMKFMFDVFLLLDYQGRLEEFMYQLQVYQKKQILIMSSDIMTLLDNIKSRIEGLHFSIQEKKTTAAKREENLNNVRKFLNSLIPYVL